MTMMMVMVMMMKTMMEMMATIMIMMSVDGSPDASKESPYWRIDLEATSEKLRRYRWPPGEWVVLGRVRTMRGLGAELERSDWPESIVRQAVTVKKVACYF
jgi:hypothetical protein